MSGIRRRPRDLDQFGTCLPEVRFVICYLEFAPLALVLELDLEKPVLAWKRRSHLHTSVIEQMFTLVQEANQIPFFYYQPIAA